jgi:hypothetical protein
MDAPSESVTCKTLTATLADLCIIPELACRLEQVPCRSQAPAIRTDLDRSPALVGEVEINSAGVLRDAHTLRTGRRLTRSLLRLGERRSPGNIGVLTSFEIGCREQAKFSRDHQQADRQNSAIRIMKHFAKQRYSDEYADRPTVKILHGLTGWRFLSIRRLSVAPTSRKIIHLPPDFPPNTSICDAAYRANWRVAINRRDVPKDNSRYYYRWE